jgi:glycerol uptake facilitator
MFGATLVWLAYCPHWKETPDSSAKLAVFSTMPAIRATWPNLLCEIIGTATLVFGVLAIPSSANLSGPGWATGFGPLIVGLLVFAIGLSLGGPTGYAINPARDFGPRLVHAILPIAGKGDSGWGYSWIPIVGPILGGVLGAWAYRLFYT